MAGVKPLDHRRECVTFNIARRDLRRLRHGQEWERTGSKFASRKAVREVEIKRSEGKEEHARERGEMGHSCLTFASQAAGVFIRFRNDSDSYRLQARVSEKGEKVNKKKEKSESCRLHMAQHRMQTFGDQLGRQN